MKKISLLIVCLCLFVPGIFAQTEAFNPIAQTHLTVANGLPQSFISSLAQDRTGFIWIATRDGLARYDGKTCKVFTHIPGKSNTLAHSVIANLFLDSRDQLWINYEQGSIDILNTQTESIEHFTEDPVYHAVAGNFAVGKSIAEDQQGRIWIRKSHGTGFFVCDRRNRQLTSVPAQQLYSNSVLGMAIGKQACYFLGDTALFISGPGAKPEIRPYTFSHPRLLPSGRPWKDLTPIVRNSSTELVSLDEERLIIYDTHLKTFSTIALPYRQLYMLPCIAQDDSGNIFLGYDKTIYLLNRRNELKLWRAERAGYREPVSMMVDRSGMLWVGGNGSSLQGYDLRLSRISSFSYRQDFIKDLFHFVLHLPEPVFANSFLAHTKPYMLRWAAGQQADYWLSDGADKLTPVPQLLHLKENRLSSPDWHYINGDREEHKSVSGIVVSNGGLIWGIDHDFRPVQFDPVTGDVRIYPPMIHDSLSIHNLITGMVMTGNDTCWVATMYHGLIRYIISSNSVTRYMWYKGQVAAELTSIVADKSNADYLWLGSLGGGLIRYSISQNRYSALTTDNGLPNNTVYAILPDARGWLWCSSNRGIFSFDPQSLKVIHAEELKYANSGSEFNRSHCFRMPDGRMVFGGIDGYIVFDPGSIVRDDFSPEVAITNIVVNNDDATDKKNGTISGAFNSLHTIRLPYNKNFLSFDFAALEFNMPEKIKYRYILEGLDNKWIEAGTKNTASYTNIPPGAYTLKIEATNTAGQWSNKIKSLRIIISPPLWKTWWFTGCWLVLLLILLLLLVRRQITVIRRNAQIRLKHERDVLELEAQALRAQMNPHFIFNCLNSIKALIQENNRKEAVHYLTSFSRLIRNQISNARKEVSLYEELESCRLYITMELLRFGGRIRCTIQVAENVDTHALMVPPLIVQPFIENAIWHGILPKESGGNITVTVTQDGDHTVCTIEDDGIGREAAAIRKSHTSPHKSEGMELVKNRLELHDLLYHSGGTFTIFDKKDASGMPAGTIVYLRFKTELK